MARPQRSRSLVNRSFSCRNLAIRVIVLLAFTGTATLAQNVTAFTDDFESPGLKPFWSQLATQGTVTYPSTIHYHSFNHSVRLDTNGPTSGNAAKFAMIRHVFPAPVYGEIGVWLLDTGANVSSSNYLTLNTGPFTLGTWDYMTAAAGGFYTFSAPNVSGNTTIPRTFGWHHLVMRATATSSTLSIDGITVYSGAGGTRFVEVQLDMHAPLWRPGFTAYFDDFSFDPLGQANSACASLTVNGVGGTGHGPLAVTAPAGNPCSFQWSGAPNQPVALAITPTFVPGQQFGGALVVDVNLSNYGFVFNGASTPGFPLYTDALGQAAQSFSVSPSFAGAVAHVQGIVFDAANTCSGGIGLMTTASFEIRF